MFAVFPAGAELAGRAGHPRRPHPHRGQEADCRCEWQYWQSWICMFLSRHTATSRALSTKYNVTARSCPQLQPSPLQQHGHSAASLGHSAAQVATDSDSSVEIIVCCAWWRLECCGVNSYTDWRVFDLNTTVMEVDCFIPFSCDESLRKVLRRR